MLESNKEEKPMISAKSNSTHFHEELNGDQLKELRETTKDVLRAAIRGGRISAVEKRELHQKWDGAEEHYKTFSQQRHSDHLQPRHSIQKLRSEQEYESLAEKIISSSQENRAVWLDRKDIVSSGPGELSKKIMGLKKAGITNIYIECDNGGYSLYDSKLLAKNPDLEKWPAWDPLREAIDTAHANGMKVEAWTKNFAFCNRALDQQFREKYPDRKFPLNGPVFNQHDKATEKDPHGDWALRMDDGQLPDRTHDIFIDPANPQARKFAQDILLEIARQYPDIDGIQYDYIRYPFHNEGMGLNHNNWKQFQTEYPRHSDIVKPNHTSQIKGQLLKDWNEWKNRQVDSFVLDTSNKMRELNPKLNISAAVYPCDLNNGVRQQWARWITNGSIDTLNPMTYVPHDVTSKDAEFTPAFERKFKSDIKEILEASDGKGVLLPGIMVSRVNSTGMLREIEIVRELKLPGETLFATTVLDPKRLRELELDNAKRAFDEFTNLSKIALKSLDKNPETRAQYKELEKNTRLAVLALKAESLDRVATPQEAKPSIRYGGEPKPIEHTEAIERIETVKRQLDQLLASNPYKQSPWTKQLSKLLLESISSLRSRQDACAPTSSA